ncbi:MAG: alpha/beta fold hydrolase [Vampirovibrionales bacterium]|nr:alpha/beta fold hydrolase [Vampirovibrionales bacterium]
MFAGHCPVAFANTHNIGAHQPASAETPAPAKTFKPQTLVVPTEDGFLLNATLYRPAGAKKAPVIVLLHNLGGTQRDWEPMISPLKQAGYAVLTMDIRGHGKSAARGYKPTAHPKRFTSWRLLTEAEWQKVPADTVLMLRHLVSHSKDYPGIDPKNVAILGASVGANAAMLAGQTYAHRVQAIGLLSPRLAYKDLSIAIAAVEYPGAVFLSASQSDKQAFDAAQKLYQMVPGSKSIRLLKDAGQGTDMLQYYPPLMTDLTDWLKRVLG